MKLKVGDLVETSSEGYKLPWMRGAIEYFKKPWRVIELREFSVRFIDGGGVSHTWRYSRLQPIYLENE